MTEIWSKETKATQEIKNRPTQARITKNKDSINI